jgi:hypothetical protein
MMLVSTNDAPFSELWRIEKCFDERNVIGRCGKYPSDSEGFFLKHAGMAR